VKAASTTIFSVVSDDYDGRVRNTASGLTQEDYYNCRSASSGDSITTADIMWGQTTGDPYWQIWRAFIRFDTSGLDNDVTITSAKICLYGSVEGSDLDFYIRIQKWTSGNDGISVADYSAWNNVSYDDGTFYSTMFVVGSWNNITLSNFDVIVKAGYTDICIRSSMDINGEIPYDDFENAEDTGAGTHPPKLEITYTEGAVPAEDYVDLQSNVDGIADKGTHSSFANQKATDSIYDNMTEADQAPITGNSENFVDNSDSDVDTHTGHGTHSSFPAMQAGPDSTFDTLTEAFTEITSAKTNAFIAYRDSTTSANTPKERAWIGESVAWGGQAEMATSDYPVRFTRVAYSPISTRITEKIVVTLSDDGKLDAYVWNGASWAVTNNIGNVGTTAYAYKCFDVAYEKTSGKAMLVYAVVDTDTTHDLAYKTWIYGTGWSSEYYIDDTVHATNIQYYWIALATRWINDANEIGLIGIDVTDTDANAWIWDGSTWGNYIEITGTVAITTEECIAIECERLSGTFIAVAGEGQFIKWARFTTSWSAVGIFDINSGATTVMNWLKLAQSQGNRLMLTSVDGALDLCTAVWDEGLYGNRQWSTASSSIGSMTATTSVTAMRFTAQASKSVTNILVYIQTVLASPAYRFGIETSATTYLPSGTYVGASNYAVYTPTATGWLNLTLPSSASLTAGTVYHVTVRYDSGTIGASNYIALRRMGTVKNDFRVSENKIDSWLNVIFGTTIQNYDPLFVLRYSDVTYESMPYDTATAHTTIYGVNWFSEKWTQSGAKTITGVNIPLLKTGTPADSLYVVLRNETDSQDVATITISQADITTTLQWYEKYFSSPVSLINGKTYRLVLKSPSSISSACFTCRSLSTGQSGSLTYDGTNSVYSVSANSGSSWTDTTTQDLIYIILNDSTLGGGFVIHVPQDTSVDTHAQRCADFAWEYRASPEFRNQGLLVYGTSTGVITWRRFRAPNYITVVTSPTMAGGLHPWVQLKANPRTISGDVKILGAILTDTVLDLGAIRWDGTALTIIGVTTFSSDTVITYESFEMEFMNFGPPNYELDLEFQWTTADFDEANEYLSIYVGTVNAEALKVDVRNGGSWTNIIASLTASQWNNVSIGTYLTGATITFRFLGGTETSDTTQSSWQIDCAIIHVWSVGVNYELELEEQFTEAEYTRTYEELCIYMGTTDVEDIRVYVWITSNSSWVLLFNDLTANTWNNVSVTSYLTDSTFTIKFVDGTQSSDSVQSTWQKDCALLHTWSLGYNLNLRVRDWDLTDSISGALVYKDTDVLTSNGGGWANWTLVTGTVAVKVSYFGFWINGTFQVEMTEGKTIDVRCRLYDVTVTVQENVQSAYLVGANVTVFNSTSTYGNRIKTGITGNKGQVALTNLPNNTLTFTQYGKSDWSLVIGNATQLVSTEDQSITLTSNQNNLSIQDYRGLIGIVVGVIIPLKRHSIEKCLKRKRKIDRGEKEWRKQV
jgi:hypothetical protein